MTPEAWLDAVIARHESTLPRPQFLKAIRALSARYVERRDALTRQSAADSPGKRAAFAGFYAPLHFLTLRAILRELDAPAVPDVVDLGCGTGVAGIAWALATGGRARVTGYDLAPWARAEAAQNLRELGLRGRALPGDMATKTSGVVSRQNGNSRFRFGGNDSRGRLGYVAAWSLNELDPAKRAGVIAGLAAAATKGSPVLVVEPIARRAVPWWPDVERELLAVGGRSDEWRFTEPLPERLESLSRDAGFVREAMTARSVAAAWR